MPFLLIFWNKSCKKSYKGYSNGLFGDIFWNYTIIPIRRAQNILCMLSCIHQYFFTQMSQKPNSKFQPCRISFNEHRFCMEREKRGKKEEKKKHRPLQISSNEGTKYSSQTTARAAKIYKAMNIWSTMPPAFLCSADMKPGNSFKERGVQLATSFSRCPPDKQISWLLWISTNRYFYTGP